MLHRHTVNTRARTTGFLFSMVISLSLLSGGCGSSPAKNEHKQPLTIIASVVRYQSADVGSSAVQQECDWNSKLPTQIVEAADGAVRIDDAKFKISDGARKLSLLIVNVHAIGGKGFTGPKWATVQGRLSESGKTIGTFELGRETITGSFRACNTLRDLGDELSGDIADWLTKPKINPAVAP